MNYEEELEKFEKEFREAYFTIPSVEEILRLAKKIAQEHVKMVEILKYLRTRCVVQDGYEDTCKEIDELFEKLEETL